MRFVLLKHLRENDKLARNVYDDKGIPLAKAGSLVSTRLMQRLYDMDVLGLYILDDETSDLIIEDLIPDNVRNNILKTISNQDWDSIIDVSKEVVSALKDIKINEVDFIDAKTSNNYIEKHAVSICVYSLILGKAMGLADEQLETLAIISMLSSYGLTQIPKEIIEKPIEKLNEKELNILKNYPKINYDYFNREKFLPISALVKNGLLTIGENVDGKGFLNMAGNKLTIYSKIMHIVDCYDCLISPRPNVKEKSIQEAIEFIMARNGSAFDPYVVSTFIQIFPAYPKGMSLELSNGEIAVVYSGEHNRLRPIVRILGKTHLVDLFTDENYRNVTILGAY